MCQSAINPETSPKVRQLLPKVKQLSLFEGEQTVSRAALLAFRVITNLSRRTGQGFVRHMDTLAQMFDLSRRRAWQLIAELKAAGWIAWHPVRRAGERGIEFWPLVALPKRSRGRFGAKETRSSAPKTGSSFGPKSALSSALSTPKKCTLNASTPIKTSPVGTRDDNRQASGSGSDSETEVLSVAVPLLKEICSNSEALELAREASRKQLTGEQIKRVIAAYQAQASNIRNRGAWLREALRRGFSPPAAPATHPSEAATGPTHRPVIVREETLRRSAGPTAAFASDGGAGRDRLRQLVKGKS